MARASRFRNVIDIIGLVGSAARVAGATREHRLANHNDLVRLGIDPEQFGSIRRL